MQLNCMHAINTFSFMFYFRVDIRLSKGKALRIINIKAEY